MPDESNDPFGDLPNFGLDFNNFWASLRQAAWMKTGAVMFGGAVGEYKRTLVENGIGEEDALVLTAKTIEEVVKGVATVAAALASATMPIVAAAHDQQQKHGGKEMPS